MIKTRTQALDYLQKNLANLDNDLSDFPRDTLDVLLTEKLLEKIGWAITEEHVNHLKLHELDENYSEYMWEYLAQYIPSFYNDLAETIAWILHEIQVS